MENPAVRVQIRSRSDHRKAIYTTPTYTSTWPRLAGRWEKPARGKSRNAARLHLPKERRCLGLHQWILPPSIASQPSQAGWPGRVRSAVLPPITTNHRTVYSGCSGCFFTLYAVQVGIPTMSPKIGAWDPQLPGTCHNCLTRRSRGTSAPKRVEGAEGDMSFPLIYT